MEGEALAVGGGYKSDDGTVRAPDVKPGDRVLFENGLSDAKVDGDDLHREGI